MAKTEKLPTKSPIEQIQELKKQNITEAWEEIKPILEKRKLQFTTFGEFNDGKMNTKIGLKDA